MNSEIQSQSDSMITVYQVTQWSRCTKWLNDHGVPSDSM